MEFVTTEGNRLREENSEVKSPFRPNHGFETRITTLFRKKNTCNRNSNRGQYTTVSNDVPSHLKIMAKITVV